MNKIHIFNALFFMLLAIFFENFMSKKEKYVGNFQRFLRKKLQNQAEITKNEERVIRSLPHFIFYFAGTIRFAIYFGLYMNSLSIIESMTSADQVVKIGLAFILARGGLKL